MGAGGSTSRPSSTSALMTASRRPPASSSGGSSARAAGGPSRGPDAAATRPTNSCCSHFRENHASRTRTVSPSSTAVQADRDEQLLQGLDDEIEEIVANTLDLAGERRQQEDEAVDESSPEAVLSRKSGSGLEQRRVARSGSEQRIVARSGSVRRLQMRPSSEDIDIKFDVREAVPGVDFAKFKKVNHQGAIQNNGRILHHQESDLLWRLGLISPEAYKMTSGSRSAPTNPGPFLKTPSYDLTEEQLMANIEKEFECTI